MKRDPLDDVEAFDWDDGNIGKNWARHGVTDAECEEIFINRPLVVRSDDAHSAGETRYYALGQTDRGRRLFGAFTIRERLLRPISFRDMTARERRIYDAIEEEEDPDVQ